MKILVTGGAGRLGRSTLAALQTAGHEVVCVDRAPAPGFTGRQIDIDLLHPDAFAAFVAAEAPDAIVHLAAIAVPFSAPEADILDINSRLAFTVLDAARAHGVARVLAASSPTVIGYGSPTGWEPDYLPLDEEHRTRPWNAYALSKQLVENLVAMFARQESSTIFGAFRPCFVISPGEWEGELTQQGHTVVDRLNDPSLAAVSLYNYVDARDAADFVVGWVERAGLDANGEVFFVGSTRCCPTRPPTRSPAALPRSVRGTPPTGWAGRRRAPGAPSSRPTSGRC
jgi:UDP-glucose 4-epimerase